MMGARSGLVPLDERTAMTAKPIWETFFDAHAPDYSQNDFTKNTLPECDFLEAEFALPRGSTILDVGCGSGRHAVELARRGYAVTGLDLSAGMLAEGRRAAKAAGVTVEWLRADAARFDLPPRFDAAVGLCEGALGLLGTGDDPVAQPLAVLGNVARALKPGAKAVFTVLNAGRLLRLYSDADVAAGAFDPATLVESRTYPPRPGMAPHPVRERAFVPTEFRLLCTLAGLDVASIWGGTAGDWGRRPIRLDEFEFMAVARRPRR